MKKFKGTQGKWKVEERRTKFEVSVISEGKRICQVKSYDGILFNDPTTKQANANAKLISSAPELLEMLQKIVDTDEYSIEDYLEAKQLINKILS